MIWAGIGNREISEEVYFALRDIAKGWAKLGWHLRTGGAIGADSAYIKGAIAGGDKPDVWEDLQGDESEQETAMALAAVHHPAWPNCKPKAKRLLARNGQIVRGINLESPVDFVLAYAVDERRGGTALGLRIARARQIPHINLARKV